MSRTRTVTMTIYEIYADLLNVTTPGSRHPTYMPGVARVRAVGGSDRHEWYLSAGERPWIGDTVEVTIVESTRDDLIQRSPQHYPAPMVTT